MSFYPRDIMKKNLLAYFVYMSLDTYKLSHKKRSYIDCSNCTVLDW